MLSTLAIPPGAVLVNAIIRGIAAAGLARHRMPRGVQLAKTQKPSAPRFGRAGATAGRASTVVTVVTIVTVVFVRALSRTRAGNLPPKHCLG